MDRWVGNLHHDPIFIVLNALHMFRVDPLEEEVGLDISHHRGAAYDMSGPKKEDVEELLEVRASRHGKVEVPKEVARAQWSWIRKRTIRTSWIHCNQRAHGRYALFFSTCSLFCMFLLMIFPPIGLERVFLFLFGPIQWRQCDGGFPFQVSCANLKFQPEKNL